MSILSSVLTFTSKKDVTGWSSTVFGGEDDPLLAYIYVF